MNSLVLRAVELALVLAPWAGVGVVHLLTGQALGTGIQPAFLPLLVLCAWYAAIVLGRLGCFGRFGGTDTDVARAGAVDGTMVRWWPWVLVLAWTLVTSSWTWTLDHMGAVGEAPWSKSLKQVALLAFFVVATLAVAQAVRDGIERHAASVDGGVLPRLERAASLGLLVAGLVALVQGLAFHLPGPGTDLLARISSSNPSIAAGSEELYLGHRFVGIPRFRGPMPEPLLLGSYLLAVVPVTAAAAFAHRGWARRWRAAAAGLGAVCLLATFSRGAWAGGLATVVLFGLAMARGQLPRPSRGVALGGGLVGLVGVGLLGWITTGRAPWELPTLVIDRLAQTGASHDMSNLTRFWSWRVAWELFLSDPVAGVGWGAFGFHYFGLAPEGADAAHFGWPVANSLPLLVLAETGLVGFIAWAVVLAPALGPLAWGRGRHGAARPGFEAEAAERWGARAGTVLAIALGGVVVHGLTFSQWNLPHLWLLLGVQWGLTVSWSGAGRDRLV